MTTRSPRGLDTAAGRHTRAEGDDGGVSGGWRRETEDLLLAMGDGSTEAKERIAGVLDITLAGTDGPLLTPAGHHVTPLTPTGAPVEVRVASTSRGAAYTAVPGLSARYFSPRLRAERAATVAVAAELGDSSRAAILADMALVVGACFPDPAAVGPRTNQGTYLGVTHHPDGRLRGVRTYATVRRSPDAVAALAGAGASFRRLVDVFAGLDVDPSMAAVHVDEPEGRVHKLYARLPRTGSEPVLTAVSGRIGVEADDLVAALRSLGTDPGALGRGSFVTVRTRVDDPRIDLAVHLTRRVLGDAEARWQAAAALASCPDGSPAMADALAFARDRPRVWEVSLIALGIAPGHDRIRASTYLAPTVGNRARRGGGPGPGEFEIHREGHKGI